MRRVKRRKEENGVARGREMRGKERRGERSEEKENKGKERGKKT